MKLSIIILTFNRINHLKKCLKSIEEQKDHHFDYKILIGVNGQDQITMDYLKAMDCYDIDFYSKELPLGEARNQLVNKVNEGMILFIDDDVMLPADYLSKAQKLIEENPQIRVFGGPDQPFPGSTNFQKALSFVMGSFMAMGPTYKRHSCSGKKITPINELGLILCNMWVSQSIFSKESFPVNLWSHEENLFMEKIQNSGEQLYYVPYLYIYHDRKDSFKRIFISAFRSGMYRTVTSLYYPKSIKAIALLPQLLALIFLYCLCVNQNVFLILFAIYSGIVFIHALYLGLKNKVPNSIPLMVMFFFVFNATYPLGQFIGYIKGGVMLLSGRKVWAIN